MADTTDTTVADDSGDDDAGTALTATSTNETSTTSFSDGTTIFLESAPQRDADAEVKKAYEKLRTAEREAKQLAAKLKAFEEAQLSEQEKVARRAEEAEQRLAEAEQRIRSANLLAELSNPAHQIVNAQAAARLIDGVEYDEHGNPVNLSDVLPGFLDANPFLIAQAAPSRPRPPVVNAAEGTGSEPTPDLTADEIAAAHNLGISPERYAAMKSVKTVDEYRSVKARLNQ